MPYVGLDLLLATVRGRERGSATQPYLEPREAYRRAPVSMSEWAPYLRKPPQCLLSSPAQSLPLTWTKVQKASAAISPGFRPLFQLHDEFWFGKCNS